ncbi:MULTISPECIES: carbohydrate kinase family protein [Prochlorococcus]|uniref:carbohydrate kinase family protein n=1 Tax=Prochlorococcus TaxID=1218 RepID=UPI0005338D41|nr:MULTISPECIES: carbohydrate kinase [Prochlorococcus]KGG13657.1 Fructokinase [Prochlorococcus sp. MIT 0601]
MAKVICTGEALVDRLGPCGQDNAFENQFEDCLGGAPANVAAGLGRLGVKTAFVGCLGEDRIGEQFQKLFVTRGVDISGLQLHSRHTSRVVLVQRDSSGERSFGGFIGGFENSFADQSLDLNSLKKTFPEIAIEANWLLTGTISLATLNSRNAIFWMTKYAKNHNLKVAIDLNWRPTFWDKTFHSNSLPSKQIKLLIRRFLENAAFLKLADEEAIAFFNTNNPAEISELLSLKPSVIVTDGAKTIHWFLNGYLGSLKPFSPEVIVDTTGAGDAFTAGLLSQLVNSSFDENTYTDCENAVKFAAACGALVCGGLGAIEPQPTSNQVENFLSAQ